MLLERKPKQLSAPATARCLGRASSEPAVFLMDEPLSNLDGQAEWSRPAPRFPSCTSVWRPLHLRYPRPDRGHDHGQPHLRLKDARCTSSNSAEPVRQADNVLSPALSAAGHELFDVTWSMRMGTCTPTAAPSSSSSAEKAAAPGLCGQAGHLWHPPGEHPCPRVVRRYPRRAAGCQGGCDELMGTRSFSTCSLAKQFIARWNPPHRPRRR